MDRYLIPRHLVRITTAGLIVLIAAWAAIQGSRSEDSGTIAPLRLEEVDALVSELARCRTVTSSETAALENCRRVWTKSRRQFFGPSKTLPAHAESSPTAITGKEKIQERYSPAETERQQNGIK